MDIGFDTETYSRSCADGDRTTIWLGIYGLQSKFFERTQRKFGNLYDEVLAEQAFAKKTDEFLENCAKIAASIRGAFSHFFLQSCRNEFIGFLRRKLPTVSLSEFEADENTESPAVELPGERRFQNPDGSDGGEPEQILSAKQQAEQQLRLFESFQANLKPAQRDLLTAFFSYIEGEKLSSCYEIYLQEFQATDERQTPRCKRAFKTAFNVLKQKFLRDVAEPGGLKESDIFYQLRKPPKGDEA